MSLKAKQALAIIAGVLVAVGMMGLGLWQMSSYEQSTLDVSAERAAEPPVPLADNVAADGAIQDIYGHRVTLEGKYLPQHESLIGDAGPWRVATAFRMDDGRFVAVVRGAVDAGATPPPPPEGELSLEGVFLAPDTPGPEPTTGSDHSSLRIQQLAQEWPSPLIGGYVTLPAADAEAHGMAAAPLELPEAEGSATHRGYALQWWVFAAGAVAFGVYTARSFGKDAAKKAAKQAAAEVTEAT